MTKEELLGSYRSRPGLIALHRFLDTPDVRRTRIAGTSGSVHSLLAAAFTALSDRPSLFVLPDRESASYFLNDLENLLGDNQVLFFPSTYKKPFDLSEINRGDIQLRAEVLSKVNRGTKLPVVTYPEALCERVIDRKGLTRHSIELRVGENVSTDFINEFLLHHDFENVDFVAQAGEFSVRGGIVDIFSFANDLPYRVEFLGDTVESIRTFDPETQLSVTMMSHVTLLPDVQTGLAQESRSSFPEFIPGNTLVWCKDLPDILQTVRDGLAAVRQRNEQEGGSDSSELARVFLDADALSKHLSRFSTIESGNRYVFEAEHVLEMDCAPQPSFNKNFELLIRDLQRNTTAGFKNLLLADSPRQVERLYSIFEDLEKKDPVNNHVDFTSMNLSLHEGFIDREGGLACYTDHQIFDRYHRFRLRKNYSRSEALTVREIYSLKPGDFVTHIDHGIGRFAGLETIEVNGKPQEAVRLVYKDNDILYVSIHSLHRIARYSGKDGTTPSLHKLGSTAWTTLKQRTKRKVKDIAKELIALYAKRKATPGFAFRPDTYFQNELEASFIYEDTPDQVKATRDVKKDMERGFPMDRLICGDVGFGKTEIAIRAAFKAVTDGKQVAVLVPTTILALQHYRTFTERMKGLPCTIDYINRFKSAQKQKETLADLNAGKVDIVIGTHRLISKDVKFRDLGLMIIDEEQKFGVSAKERLKAMRVQVDTLTLTATPIPRTLQFSLMGARDLSVINTPPPNRYPVSTELHVFGEKVIRDAIDFELSRGGQVFFVHNRISDIHEIADFIRKLLPEVRVGVGHGQMDGDKLEEVMLSFIEGEYDVLVSTTIIESGLDIPNANTIIINQAQHFGLSDLHQMRGRVGRSNKKAFCYLLTPPMTVVTSEARQRLKAIEEFSDLGSGFNIAMRDLDIRGAGNLLGGEQSGFISEIGYEMYQKILDEALQELKETEFAELYKEEIAEKKKFVADCQIDTDLEILLPTDYVNSVTERLILYRDLDAIQDEERLEAFATQLRDRFGPMPQPAVELLDTIRLRWIAEELGFEKIILKNRKFVGHFISNPASPFYQSEAFSRVLRYVQSHAQNCKMRQDRDRLSVSISPVASIQEANRLLQHMGAVPSPA
ncbi:MAG: transcription-repair coupling factor [Bacteroidota bacterium]